MILPLSDSPNPRGFPLVTYTLIAINVAIYLLITLPLSYQGADPRDPAFREYLYAIREAIPPGTPLEVVARGISAYDLVVFEHGFRPAAPHLLDLLTSIFLHGGFMHLFGNMLFLWIYGDNVEYRLGRLGYLFWYLATGVAATLFYTMFAPGSKLPLVGASGAISGVLGFYFLWFPRNRVRMFVFLFPIFMNVVEISARLVLGFYLVIDNLLPFLVSRGGQGGVAHGAHIGGFVAGLAVAWFLDRRQVAAQPPRYRETIEVEAPLPTVRESISDLIAGRDMAGAARAYFALGPEQTRLLLRPDESLALAGWLAENQHADAALTVYRRQLRDYPGGPRVADAHLGAGLVQLEQQGQVASAYQHFLEALDANPTPEVEAKIRHALRTIHALQKYPLHRYGG